MDNNMKLVVKDQGTGVAKDKPKVTYKEVKRKMKKLTLTQKNRIKEDKKEQKAKDKAEKQRITQRVKININIPTSSQKSGQPIINPLNNQGSSQWQSSTREQISLLNSINEQLKNKNKPASINDMFKIPEKRTQTEPQMNRVIEEPQMTQDDEDFTQGMESINNELQERLANIQRLPEQFSPKVETPIPIIKEPTIPIISKPKEKSNESLIEQTKPKSFIEELREKQQIIKPKTEEETLAMEAEFKKGKPKSQMNEGRILTDEEVLQNKLEKEAEIEARRKANEADNLIAEKKKEQEQIKLVQAEYKRKEKEQKEITNKLVEAENKRKQKEQKEQKEITNKLVEVENKRKQKEQKEQIKLVEAEYNRKQKEQIKLVEAENKRKQKEQEAENNRKQKEQEAIINKKILDNAFSILIDHIEPERIGALRDAYNNGILTEAQIKTKLKALRSNPVNSKSDKLFTEEQINFIFPMERGVSRK